MHTSYVSVLVVGVLLGILSSCAGVISCSNENSAKTESFTLLNWNLETFFDASFDGNEYSEFKNGKSGWSREKYEPRLDRLASVIKTLDADVLVFEEVEKEAQLYDITNRLSGTFNFAKLYSHAFFAADEGSSIGCAVLSRLPIGEVSVHSLDVRTGESDQPSMRPIMQFSVFAGQSGEKKVVIFANHWKSKAGDTGGETAAWRLRQEAVLSRCMQAVLEKKKVPVLACGDFNMDILEFASYAGEPFGADGKKVSVANVLLRSAEGQATGGLPVYSPWFDAQGNLLEPGSYWYNDAWERIDNFFCAGEVRLSAFSACTNGPWANSAGKPVRYQLYNGEGYSDHLPIMCTVTF